MKVVWKCDAIYFELSILFLLIMIYIASCFVFRILSSKELCENKLKEHKQALSQTTSLLASESKKNKRIQQFLNKSREQYQLIADNTTDVIWLTDMNNICTYISPSSFNMTGFTPKEIIGKPIDALMLPDYQRKLKEIYNEKLILIKEGDAKGWESEKFELQEYCKNEKIIWAELDAGFYPNKNNNPAGFIGVTRNITTQILLEKEIIKAQQIAIKQGSGTLVGKIAENIAHDFNSIFGIIMKNTAVPLLKHKDSEIQDSLGVILNQTRQGQALARALISFAKNKKSKKEFLQINKKIDFVMTLFKPDLKEIEVIKEYMPGTPDMLADSGMIEHALANLIQNSIHALSFTENPKIIARTYYSDNKITIEIEDNGCGIPKEYFEKIYEPSFTLKGNQDITDSYKPDIQGTGYGMTNVKQYVDQHRGKLSIESKFGSGTKIILSLPML
ncbi:PAS domain S-box protein, partial [bacterium]|nr:PAS domain S-box protein [bacterium]